MRLIIARPEDAAKGAVYRLSDRIINEFRKEEEVAVIGFGNAASLASMAVQRSISIANISISESTLDYVGSRALSVSGIFLVLDKKSKIDWNAEGKKLEAKMTLTFGPDGQVIIVSRNLSPDTIIPLCLSKLAKTNLLKIGASGNLINRAVPIVLELTKGTIAKDPVGIKLLTLSTVSFTVGTNTILETGMNVYLEKGMKTKYSLKHRKILKMLEQQ